MNIPQSNSTTPQPAPSLHERMWNHFRADLQHMQDEGVKALDPVVALRFMDYIETVEKEVEE